MMRNDMWGAVDEVGHIWMAEVGDFVLWVVYRADQWRWVVYMRDDTFELRHAVGAGAAGGRLEAMELAEGCAAENDEVVWSRICRRCAVVFPSSGTSLCPSCDREQLVEAAEVGGR